jgi:hypothetical protein
LDVHCLGPLPVDDRHRLHRLLDMTFFQVEVTDLTTRELRTEQTSGARPLLAIGTELHQRC